VIHVGAGPSRLPLDDCELHVFDLDPNEQEVDLANNHILQVVLGLVVPGYARSTRQLRTATAAAPRLSVGGEIHAEVTPLR
jgi:hypothetical protein